VDNQPLGGWFMIYHRFARLATATPELRVADCGFNVEHILAQLAEADTQGVAVVVFPELCITGYTCADLFQQITLLRSSISGLERIAEFTVEGFAGLAVVGLPLLVDDQLFNCAAVLHRGKVLGVVPKSYLPNYKEFYEARWFSPAGQARSREIPLLSDRVPFGTDLLFTALDSEELVIGVEICEDLWVPSPPSCSQALAGATVLLNLSASNDIIGKAAYRRQLVVGQSGRCLAAYAYAACGVWESTTDLVFGGHSMIAENGTLLAESARFQRKPTLTIADVDLERLRADRIRIGSFAVSGTHAVRPFRKIGFSLREDSKKGPATGLRRTIDASPFVPKGQEQLRERCEEIFHIQVAGLARRVEQVGSTPLSIGISGGLDSTLALLVVCKTCDTLGQPRDRIRALTMPGFGTTSRTHTNALALMRQLGVTFREVDIRPLCFEEMKAQGYHPFGISLEGITVAELDTQLRHLPADARNDLGFENVQARMRTSLLMNSGFVIGTGDLSELALGWCTYNADHMSMYNPNVSIPKTLVKFLVDWAARNEFEGPVSETLLDIVATPIAPELLPTDAEGQAVQLTESSIGPYELHDFFLFHALRYGETPSRILFLARHASFSRPYSFAELRQWLGVFLRRFFASQYKRSCLPDGPKVGSISLSPRGDWRMPSDAAVADWLRELEALPPG
jgi:NAD+ synthase (glutamine-hydrolysing)